MNFLALVNRLKREVGASGSALTAVTGLTGESQRLVDWINSAWLDIQSLREDWEWMRSSCSFVTVAGQTSYTPAQCGITDFGNWDRENFRNYVTATGIASEIHIDYIDYQSWRDTYLIGANRTSTGQPNVFTILPNKSVGFGPVTAAGYTITGDYFTLPSEMAATTDTPSLPVQYHMLIVYKAMMDYGGFDAASEVYQRGEKGYKDLMGRLTANQLPEIGFAGALA